MKITHKFTKISPYIIHDMYNRLYQKSCEKGFYEHYRVQLLKSVVDSLSRDMLNRKYKETNEYNKIFIEVIDFFCKDNSNKIINKKTKYEIIN